MARDYAQIRTDIWADTHWRTLTPGAQWLYEMVLTSPTMTLAGVADWRPSRIAKLARGLTVEAVRKYADELARGRFVAFDDDTEEIVVRSFLRHDGVLVNPNLWKSLGRDFAGIYSLSIKALVSSEVARLRAERPDGLLTAKGGIVNPWASKYLQTLVKSASDTLCDTPSDTPSNTPSETPSPMGSGTGSPPTPTPSPTPRNASHSSARARSKSREVSLPKDWAPSAEHLERARALGVDISSEAENFRLHAEAHDRKAVNWNAAFTMWLKKSQARPGSSAPVRDIRDGIEWRGGKPMVGGPNGMTSAQYRTWEDSRVRA